MVSSVEVTTECESRRSAPGSTRICQALTCSWLASPSSAHGGEGSGRKGTGATRVDVFIGGVVVAQTSGLPSPSPCLVRGSICLIGREIIASF